MADEGGGSADVYIRSKEFAWIPARMVEQDETTAKVAIPQYETEEDIKSDGGKGAIGFKSAVVQLKDYAANVLPLQNVGPDGTLTEVNDMVDLPYLHEAAILFNLKSRLAIGLPYSRVADIVIAVNPYTWLTHLYADEIRMHYAQKIVWDDNDADPRIGLEPHIYEISSLCYKGLAINTMNQSILVSGESGAGKTETVKICMNHIATVQQDPNEVKEEGMSPVVQRILDSNPLLEAFGNANTRRNDNSSRFGKYIMLQFEHLKATGGAKPRAALAGSTCEVYLLEKSRIVTHDPIERTYHIFYQLLGAPEDVKCEIWKGLKGVQDTSFAYVGKSPIETFEGRPDGEHFADTRKALEIVGIKGDGYITLFRAIAAVLQLGQLTFAPKPDNEEETVITSMSEFNALADLLGCDLTILRLAFTERTIKTRGEEYKVPLLHDISKESANAFAKEIYAKVFLWLVRAINDATCAENNWSAGDSVEYGIIGLLDIFGFESFPINGFEQLCINYCNEKLQQKFTKDIFATVVAEYEEEGLDLAEVKYDDNSDILELIEGKVGMIKQLNEECVRPKGNDQAFVTKALKSNSTAACLIQKRTFSPVEFGIHHFAGAVVYCGDEFVTRNTDTLPADLKDCAKACENEIISKHLDNNKSSNQVKKVVEDKSARAAPKRAKSSLHGDTVMTQFKSQLTNLMKGLALTQSRYIRCVKPNTKKKALVMMHVTTLDQLRSAGVVAAVTISRSAYPSKLDFPDVLPRYGMLNEEKKKSYPDDKTQVLHLFDTVLKKFEKERDDGTISKPYAVGKTKVYFKAGCMEYLESQHGKIWYKWAVKIQAPARGWMCRVALEKARKLEEERLARLKAEAEAAAKAEAERIQREKEEAEAAAKAEEERLYRIAHAEEIRAAEEKAAEEARIAKEKAEREEREERERREEEERIMAEKNAEEARIMKEKREKEEREAREKKEREEREAKEKKEREEREAKEKREREEREAKEKKEREEREMKEKYERELKAVVPIQCLVRCILARQKIRNIKREKKLAKRMGKKWKKSCN